MQHKFECDGGVFEGFFRDPRMVLPSPADMGVPTRTVDLARLEIPFGLTKPYDTDLLAPEYEDYFGEDAPFAVARMRGTSRNGVWVYRWHIAYNMTKIAPLNPGPNDRRRYRAHERYHCAGWGHGEGTPETNACFSPTVTITGT